jgi:hypothetical protein
MIIWWVQDKMLLKKANYFTKLRFGSCVTDERMVTCERLRKKTQRF